MEGELHAVVERARMSPAYLPADIIRELFYAAAEISLSRPPQRRYPERSSSLGWITMTHVCARWRAVGLDMSDLWADMVCLFPYAMETVVARTKTTPLKIDLRSSHLDCEDDEYRIAKVIADLKILPRARDLRWTCGNSLHDWSAFLLSQTFPHLQHLDIQVPVFTDAVELKLGPVRVVAPALESFTTNVPLAVTAPLLTHFDGMNNNIWPLKCLLEYLKGFPLLVDVSIGAILSDDESLLIGALAQRLLAVAEKMDRRIASASTIRLAHLETMQFGMVGQNALSFLHHLETPALTKFVVHDVYWAGHMQGLFAYLDYCHTPRNVLTLIHCCDEKDSLFFSWTETDPYFDVHDWEATTLSRGTTIRFNVCGDYVVVPDILKAIPSSCDIHTLALKHDMQECDEDGTICQGSVEWNELDSFIHALSVFRNVTTLYLIGYQHADVGLIICSKLDAAECSFPALRELVLDLTGVTYKTWWDDLRTGLLLRQTLGRQVDCLTVRGKGACHACPQSDGEKRRARGVVERAVCDGDITEWLEGCCLITLKEERQLVGRVIDERSKDACLCLKNIWAGTYPWDFS